MRLIWKLLQQHISPGQLCGFFFANLFGMAIVLLGLQFYKDVAPAFSGGDSFIRSDFVVLTKRIGTLGSLSGSVGAFRRSEVDEVAQQPFAGRVGVFTPSTYNVNAALDLGGSGTGGFRFSTDMFFESVPDAFVDVQADSWRYAPGTPEIPIILPRSYLNLYNFGFAQSRSLPKISEGLMESVNANLAQQEAYYLAKCGLDLSVAGKSGDKTQFVEALDSNQKLWIMIKTLMSTENSKLPKETRNNLIKLADYVAKNTIKLGQNLDNIDQKMLDSFININRQISEGLLGHR